MTDEGEQNPIVEVTQAVEVAPEKPKKVSDWFPVSLKKDMIARIDKVHLAMGIKSRGEYVRVAVQKSLEKDEAEKEETSDVSTGRAGQPGV